MWKRTGATCELSEGAKNPLGVIIVHEDGAGSAPGWHLGRTILTLSQLVPPLEPLRAPGLKVAPMAVVLSGHSILPDLPSMRYVVPAAA